MAKFLRLEKKMARKNPLAKRVVTGTWVGTYDPTSENIVITEEGKAIRIRTIFRRPKSERWNADAILKVKSTPVKLVLDQDSVNIPVLKDKKPDESEIGDINMDTQGKGIQAQDGAKRSQEEPR